MRQTERWAGAISPGLMSGAEAMPGSDCRFRAGRNAMKIVCVGGGPAGLYFAILMKLHDHRHDITILERNPPGYTYGWGVTLWEHLMETLRRGDPESALMIRRSARRWSGQVVEIQGRKTLETGEYHGYSISRQCLLDILTKRAGELDVRVEFGREVSCLSDVPECDLIVGSDGVNSRLRELAAAEFATNVHVGRDKYIWLGTDKVFDSFTYAFTRTEPGWIRCHAYGVDSKFSTSTFIGAPTVCLARRKPRRTCERHVCRPRWCCPLGCLARAGWQRGLRSGAGTTRPGKELPPLGVEGTS